MPWHPTKGIDRTNLARAKTARKALCRSLRNRGESPVADSDSVGDLLADLMHFCDWKGLDFDSLLKYARLNYNEEK